MYRKNKAYDNASGVVFDRIMPGGYMIGIVEALETTSKKNKPMIEMKIDIADGNMKYFFNNLMKNSASGKWSPSGKYYVMIPDESANEGDPTLNRFKAFMEVVEASNPMRSYWDQNTGELLINAFRGSVIGSVWGDEEYMNKNGKIVASARINAIISIEDLKNGNFEIPEVKKFVPNPSNIPTAAFMDNTSSDGFMPVDPSFITDQDVPF